MWIAGMVATSTAFIVGNVAYRHWSGTEYKDEEQDEILVMEDKYPIYSLTCQEIGINSESDYIVNEKYTFNGENKLITSNGISSISDSAGNTVYLTSGELVTPCKNQYINHRDFMDEKKILCHMHFKVSGHSSNCQCGSCNYRFDFNNEPVCNCEQKPSIDPGEEKCNIM